MNAFGLTPEQERFATHEADAFVQACPGAGKTRTIVARIANIAKTLPPRRGVAVLSFTHSAVDEFTKRSREAGLDPLLRHPCFVGTFDSFVRHFVILPAGVSACDSRPIVIDSWESLNVEIHLSGKRRFRGPGVSLDKFDALSNDIDPESIGHNALRQHVRAHRAAYVDAATRHRRALNRKGYLSANDARVQARNRVLDAGWDRALGRAFAARFHEVIVDEGQDCNPFDLEILASLRRHGLRVTVVCDLDQAIYGFRHGSPGDLRAFADSYPPEGRLSLSANFRSSGPICALAATLRLHEQADIPLGQSANITHPIIVLAYAGPEVPPNTGRAFMECLRAAGLPCAEGIVLAHARRSAQRAVGHPSRQTEGQSKIEILARAIGEFWATSMTSRSRDEVLRSVERLLLDLMAKREPDEHPRRAIERHRLDARQLRRQALALVTRLPRVCSETAEERSAWVAFAQAEVERLGLELPEGKSVLKSLPSPKSHQWSRHLRAPVAPDLPCSTIHEAKGREFEAVCVVLPPDRAPDNRTSHLFDSWVNREDDEAKRVIYVGVTRAKKVVMLAVPEVFVARCSALLARGQVPYELRHLPSSL